MTQEKRKWRVAIAGCHRMVTRTPGSHNFGAAFNAVPEVQVVGVFDFGAETRAEFVTCWRDVWGEVTTYDDYERMLSEIRPDLLCIATRQTMHADQIELAVQSGVRGILCDNPSPPASKNSIESAPLAKMCRCYSPSIGAGTPATDS